MVPIKVQLYIFIINILLLKRTEYKIKKFYSIFFKLKRWENVFIFPVEENLC